MNKFPTESDIKEKPGWKDIPIGGLITNAGSSMLKKTGGWRSFRPVLDKDKCINCMICFAYCPDECIVVKNGEMIGMNYDYCKGCGICANVCPVKAIKMEEENKFIK